MAKSFVKTILRKLVSISDVFLIIMKEVHVESENQLEEEKVVKIIILRKV